MSNLSRRHLLTGGVIVLAGAAGIGYAMTGGGARAYDHTALSVADMQASGALIVDIRTPPEWRQTGVIDGARLVEFDFDRPQTFLPQIADEIADGRDLILICRSGNRTRAAADYLAGQIDNRIISVKGGMKGVMSAGYTPVSPG